LALLFSLFRLTQQLNEIKDTDGAAETYDVPQKNRKGMAAHLAADYLSDRRKIAKKIAKNKRCYANTLQPPLKDAVEGDEGGLGGSLPPGSS
jgi:hypothetical protein